MHRLNPTARDYLAFALLCAALVLAGCNTAPKSGDIVIPPPPAVRY